MTAATPLTKREEEEISRILERISDKFNGKILVKELPPPAIDDPESVDAEGFQRVQTRVGEDTRGISYGPRMRSVLCDPGFWNAAAHLPDNDVHSPRRWIGTPLHYPSWMLFALMCLAGVQGIDSLQNACTLLRDPVAWAEFERATDAYIPRGWTRVSDLPERGKRNHKRHYNESNGQFELRAPYAPRAYPPLPHHLEHFLTRWRAQPTLNMDGEEVPHPWAGVRQAVFQQFRLDAMALAQELGYLDPDHALFWKNPDRTQAVVYDGTVFTFKNATEADASCNVWHIGGPKGTRVVGSKITTAMVRGPEHGSRVILDVLHTGKHTASEGSDEAASIMLSLRRLTQIAHGGIKILIVDSVIRGQQVSEIQRDGIIVVNYPHAAANPDARKTQAGKRRKRINPNRKEKSRLRDVVRHRDERGLPCVHPIYAVGGMLVHVTQDSDGEFHPHPVTIEKYERQRDNKTVREYQIVAIPCGTTVIRRRVPLFHDERGGLKGNWGEFVRVWGPHTPQMAYLYGRRNDSESHFNALKDNTKWMLHDAADQLARVLGASLSENALTRQRARYNAGLPNAISDTLNIGLDGP